MGEPLGKLSAVSLVPRPTSTLLLYTDVIGRPMTSVYKSGGEVGLGTRLVRCGVWWRLVSVNVRKILYTATVNSGFLRIRHVCCASLCYSIAHARISLDVDGELQVVFVRLKEAMSSAQCSMRLRKVAEGLSNVGEATHAAAKCMFH